MCGQGWVFTISRIRRGQGRIAFDKIVKTNRCHNNHKQVKQFSSRVIMPGLMALILFSINRCLKVNGRMAGTETAGSLVATSAE